MTYRISLSFVVWLALVVGLVTVTWLALQGGDATVAAPKLRNPMDWGWQ